MLLDQECDDSTSIGKCCCNDRSASKTNASSSVLGARLEVMRDIVNLDANIVMRPRAGDCDQVEACGRSLYGPKRDALSDHRPNRKLLLSEDGTNDLARAACPALKVNPDVVVMHGRLAAQRLT
jgi:hypothetical protein